MAVSVWVEMGRPVARCTRAAARRTRSTPGVRPGLSVAHFKMPGRTPEPEMPFSMSWRKNSSNMSTPEGRNGAPR